jgi:nucleoside-diphosphate-sugar epimerase
VEHLVTAGARVRAFCLYTSQDSHGWIEDLPGEARSRLDIRRGDVRDARFVEECCEGIDIVYHLAAVISVPYSYTAPETFIETNIRGTLNVLEGVRRHGVSRLIHTSTSEVYGMPETLPIRETHPMRAQSPYAASKIAADQLVLSYHRSFGTPAMILRPFNTYGPRQSSRAVLPTILLQLLEGRKEISLGRLDTRRDLTFVSDTVEGFLAAGQAGGLHGEILQLGTGRSVAIGELFETVCNVAGINAVVREDPGRLRPESSEILILESDASRAREKLGWSPKVSLEEGVRRTLEWFRSRRHQFKSTFLV